MAAGQQADEQGLLQPALADHLAAEGLRQPLQRVTRPRHLVGAQDESGRLFHRVIVNNAGMRRRRRQIGSVDRTQMSAGMSAMGASNGQTPELGRDRVCLWA